MVVVRLCHPHNYKDMYELNDDQKTFRGPIGDIANRIIIDFDQYFNEVFNDTSIEVHPNRGVGSFDPAKGMYDGCLGELQSNQSDFILMFWEYPFGAPNISEGLIVYETTLVIGGMYDQENIGGAAQILDSFKNFTLSVWLSTLMATLAIFFVLKVYDQMRKKSKKYTNGDLFTVLAHCSGYGCIPSGGITRCTLFMMASAFCFLVVTAFLSTISTELVIIKQPQVYHTYKDVMDRKAVPLFIQGMAYDDFFKRSSAIPLRKQLWEYAVKNFGADNLYVDIDPIAFMLCAMKLVLREAVMILETGMMPVLPGSGCPFAAFNPEKLRETSALIQDHERLVPLLETLNFGEEQKQFILDFTRRNPMDFSHVPDFNFHTATDPEEKRFSQSILLSENSDLRVRDTLIKVCRRLIEIGYPVKTIGRLEKYNLLQGNQMIPVLLGTPNKTRKYKVENCFSETVLLPEAHFESVTFDNLYSLVITTSAIYLSIVPVLIGEVIHSKIHMKKRKLEKRKRFRNALAFYSHRENAFGDQLMGTE